MNPQNNQTGFGTAFEVRPEDIGVNDNTCVPAASEGETVQTTNIFTANTRNQDPIVQEISHLISVLQTPNVSNLKRERAEKRIKKILKRHVRKN